MPIYAQSTKNKHTMDIIDSRERIFTSLFRIALLRLEDFISFSKKPSSSAVALELLSAIDLRNSKVVLEELIVVSGDVASALLTAEFCTAPVFNSASSSSDSMASTHCSMAARLLERLKPRLRPAYWKKEKYQNHYHQQIVTEISLPHRATLTITIDKEPAVVAGVPEVEPEPF
jgi:hypothetical protein